MRPIAQVSQVMGQMVGGNLELRVPVIGGDEISDMARIFNRMVDALRETMSGLGQERDKLTTILLAAREGIVVTNADNRVVLVNPAATRLLGKEERKIVEEGFSRILDDPDFVESYLKAAGADMPEVVVYNQRVLNFHAATIRSASGRSIGSAALFRDITEEKRLEEEMRALSVTDGLTGLLNRRRLDELLLEECERSDRYGQEYGLLLLDIDHFKLFNDRHGHQVGDQVLKAVAVAMRAHFRHVDFCCRYGGEEFAVVMPNTVVPGIELAADRFRQRVEAMEVSGLKVTISIGIAIYRGVERGRKGIPVEELISRADKALYRAKAEGRNRVSLWDDSPRDVGGGKSEGLDGGGGGDGGK
ncbi:MAG: diguanylate cyclase [Magnetococcales bacterium]|nr:diguanylate cyclase [Magnetococcales bacterium]